LCVVDGWDSYSPDVALGICGNNGTNSSTAPSRDHASLLTVAGVRADAHHLARRTESIASSELLSHAFSRLRQLRRSKWVAARERAKARESPRSGAAAAAPHSPPRTPRGEAPSLEQLPPLREKARGENIRPRMWGIAVIYSQRTTPSPPAAPWEVVCPPPRRQCDP
jgi:hypothetical protein